MTAGTKFQGDNVRDPKREMIRSACKLMLEPVVRFLIRNGFGAGVLLALCKETFVDVASKEFVLQGRRLSDSRLSILTGLSRREVKSIREQGISAQAKIASNSNRANRVMNGWYTDPRFIGPDGSPLALPFENASPSFASLVRAHSGDIPARALVEELLRLGNVRQDQSGRLVAVNRILLPDIEETAAIQQTANMIADIGRMTVRNLDERDERKRAFQRSVFDTEVDPRALPLFRKYMELRGTNFLEQMEDWLAAHKTQGRNRARISIYLNVAE